LERHLVLEKFIYLPLAMVNLFIHLLLKANKELVSNDTFSLNMIVGLIFPNA
jgi:hypothetical protein